MAEEAAAAQRAKDEHAASKAAAKWQAAALRWMGVNEKREQGLLETRERERRAMERERRRIEKEEKVVPPQRDRWWYKTPTGDVHGPFTPFQMQLWHRHMLFKRDLPVKLEWYKDFYPLGSLYEQNWADAFFRTPAHPPVEQPP